jgi:hypothetical protein
VARGGARRSTFRFHERALGASSAGCFASLAAEITRTRRVSALLRLRVPLLPLLPAVRRSLPARPPA